MHLGLLTAVMAASVSLIATADAVVAALEINANATNETSSTRALQDTVQHYVLCGVDIVGRDRRHVQASHPDLCAFYTIESDAVTWTDFEGGTCWLKDASTFDASALPPNPLRTTANPRAVSLVRRDDTSYPFVVMAREQGYDMPGFDIGSVPGPTPTRCVVACGMTPTRFAATWSPNAGGTCWLKSRASALVAAPQAVAMYLAKRFESFGRCEPI